MTIDDLKRLGLEFNVGPIQPIVATPAPSDFASIPIPPSANAIWRSVRVKGKTLVLKSKAYRLWLKSAESIMAATMRPVPGPVSVTIRVGGKKFNKQRDLDNCIKPIIDALRHSGRIDGDSVKTVKAIAAFYASEGETFCEVKIQPHR